MASTSLAWLSATVGNQKEQLDSAERGVVSEILKDNVKCSCEFGFRLPTSLADIYVRRGVRHC